MVAAASKCLAEGGSVKVLLVAFFRTWFYANFSGLGMGTALEGCQLNETCFGMCVGALEMIGRGVGVFHLA